MTYTDSNGQRVALGRRLGGGGEADIFSVNGRRSVVAKIYFTPSAERTAKLKSMTASPPVDPTRGQGHVSICWPGTLLFSPGSATCVGFLMHRVDFSSNVAVLQLYNPLDRQQVAPAFNWGYLLRSTCNISSVVESIHACGCVIGDLNESNFFVSDRALVTLVDCDSMQVPTGRGDFFRCTVGKPDFTAPELQGKDFSQVNRDPTHDNFALGVMIFHLLMEGMHPYAGVWRGRGDPPLLEQRIRTGDSPYAGSSNVLPMPMAVPFEILPATLRWLVGRCFGHGHKDPSVRPSAREWREALSETERNLRKCAQNQGHVYPSHLTACPWCARRVLLGGFDPFPGRPGQQQPLNAKPFVSSISRPPQPAPVPVPPRGPVVFPPPHLSPPQLIHIPATNRSRNALAILSFGAIAVFLWYVYEVGSRKPTPEVSSTPVAQTPAPATNPQPRPAAAFSAETGNPPGVGGTETATFGASPATADQSQSAATAQDLSRANPGIAADSQTGLTKPTVIAFEAVPSVVDQCAVTILRWTVADATRISIDHGIGLVDGPAGYRIVRPVQTTTYTLTAENAGNSVTQQLGLSVRSGSRTSCGN